MAIDEESLEDYVLNHSDGQGALLRELERDAQVNLLHARMISGPLQGRVLKMFCRMIRPKRVLEIGTYTGYATMCLAEGLEEDALVYTIEINDEMEDFIMKYLPRCPWKDRIHLLFGDALEIVPTLDETFDLVFIDGDKRQYCDYFDTIFPKVRKGGIILADNTLWDGHVTDSDYARDHQTIGIRAFNDKIRQDERVEKVILPLRDGLTMIWKR